MLKQQSRLVTAAIFVLDIALTAGAFVLAYRIRDSLIPVWFPRRFATGLYPFQEYRSVLPFVLAIFTFFFWYFGLYKSHRTHTIPREILELLRSVTASTLTFLGVVFALRLDFVSRPWLAIFAILTFTLLLGEKLMVRVTARWVRKRGFNYRNLLIGGDGPAAVRLAEIVRSHPHWGYRFIGYLSDGAEPIGKPALGSLDDLEDILRAHVVDDVIFVLNRRKLEDMNEAIFTCQEMGINTRVALHSIPVLGGTLRLEQIDHTPLLTLSRTPSNLPALIAKRIIDIAVSILLLLVSAPLGLVIAAWVRIGSPGPAIYRQIRVGRNGRTFKLYKFRTMFVDAEKRIEEVRHLNEMDGPVFKMKRDPRITPQGRWLRKFSLDELPQFVNVLKGDMSLVGPRPPIPGEVEKYEKWQRRRLSMKPGLTCTWQVSGRNRVNFDKWMEMDLEYIDNWSLALDFKIMLKTLPAVILGRGAG